MDSKGQLSKEHVSAQLINFSPTRTPVAVPFYFIFSIAHWRWIVMTLKRDSSCPSISVVPIWPTSVSLKIDELEHKSGTLSV